MNFITAIFEEGGEVYEVGGSLRDKLLNIEIKDQDLLVRKLPLPILQKTLKPFGHVELVGKSFGVLKFKCFEDQKEYDIALPRSERSTGTGHRDFEITQDAFLNIEEDLKRRDFTINAMAKNLQTGEILDPFGGKRDLENKTLRQVFKNTFIEDPLRILRAIQFSTRFSLEIESETFQAIVKNKKLLKTVSSERVIEELRKLFLSEKPSLGFQLFLKAELLPYLFPHLLTESFREAWSSLLSRMDILSSSDSVASQKNLFSLFANLFILSKNKCNLEAAQDWLEKYPLSLLGLDHKTFLKFLKLWSRPINHESSDYEIRHFIHDLQKEWVAQWLNLKNSFEEDLSLKARFFTILKQKPPLEIKDLVLQGRDLLKLGFEPGPKLGTILQDLLHLVLKHPEKNKTKTLMDYIKTHYLKNGTSLHFCEAPNVPD